jgi:tetratricopeptide (TPR) repeat protein
VIPFGSPESLLPLALSRPREAERQARRVLTAGPSALDRSFAHQTLGIVLRDRGQLDDAFRELRAALRAAESTQSKQRIADVLATEGVAQVVAGRTRAGLGRLTRALGLSSGAMRARVQLRRAYVLALLGRYQEALDDLRKASAAFRATNDVVWEGRSLNNRCLVHLALGSLARAERDAVRAEQLFVAADQELEAAQACLNRAEIAYRRGDLPESLRLLDVAGQRYIALGGLSPAFVIDRSTVLLAAGLAADALEIVTEALGRSDLQPSRHAELLLAAATAALAAAEPGRGEEYARQAHRMFQAQKRAWWALRSRLMQLRCQFAQGQASGDMLAASAEVAAALRAAHSDEATIGYLLTGQIAARLRHESARAQLTSAAAQRRRGSALNRTVGWLAQGLACQVDEQPGRVLAACGRGLDALDEYRMTLGSTELRALATEHARALSDLALGQAVAAGDRTLLEWTERTRATTLLSPSVLTPRDPSLAGQLAALRAVASRLEQARAAGTPTGWLERERARHEAAIRAKQHHRKASGHGSLSLIDVGRLVEAVGDALLVELVDVDGTLYAIAVHRGRVERHEVGPLDAALRSIEFARFQLRRVGRGRRVDLAEVGAHLEQSVLGDTLRGMDGIPAVVVPPSRLHGSPWGLAPSLLHRPFTVAPSAAIWLRSQRTAQPANDQLVLVAGPGLGSEGAEVRTVAARRPDAILLEGDDAITERVLTAIDGASLVHIAAHGKLRLDNPMFSELRLHDGALTVHDFENLTHAPYRLVLSACDSGMVAAVGTDELLGLATSLLGLGSAGVVASVTLVNDAATVTVMETVHRALELGTDLANAMLAGRESALHSPVELAVATSFVGLGT